MAVLRVGVFGQNIAKRLVSPEYTGILQTEIQRSNNTIATISFVSSNSSLLSRNARDDVSYNHWWNEVDNVPGPALLQAKNYIDLEQKKPTVIVFDPGTFDGTDEAFDLSTYYGALVQVIETLQAACNPEDFHAVKVILITPSRHGGLENIDQLRLLRRAQAIPVKSLGWAQLDCYDLPALSDDAIQLYVSEENSVAMTALGMTRLSYRLAHSILYVNDLPCYKAPKMDITRLDLSNIAVQISDNARPLNMPTVDAFYLMNTPNFIPDIPHLTILRPGGFVPYPQEWIRFEWQYSASGTVLRIEMQNEELSPGSVLMYPDNDLDVTFHSHNTMTDAADMPLATTAEVVY